MRHITRTDIVLDDELVREAVELTGADARSKIAVVDLASGSEERQRESRGPAMTKLRFSDSRGSR